MNFFNAWRNKKKNIEAEMSFFEHLAELRKHLVRIGFALVFFMIFAFVFFDTIFNTILLGPKNSHFLTYRVMCYLSRQFPDLIDGFCDIKFPMQLINTQLAGQFVTQINTAFVTAIVLTIPYAFWEIWRFIKPGLTEAEVKASSGFVIWAALLFLIGLGFGYFIICPLSVHFLSNFSISSEINNQITIASYTSLVSTLSLLTGVVFELPILVYILSKIGLLTSSFMSKHRRYAILLVLILAAVITPTPDIITMLAVGIPIYMLYEISILVAARNNKPL